MTPVPHKYNFYWVAIFLEFRIGINLLDLLDLLRFVVLTAILLYGLKNALFRVIRRKNHQFDNI